MNPVDHPHGGEGKKMGKEELLGESAKKRKHKSI
jgi:ribosomal protein L2